MKDLTKKLSLERSKHILEECLVHWANNRSSPSWAERVVCTKARECSASWNCKPVCTAGARSARGRHGELGRH